MQILSGGFSPSSHKHRRLDDPFDRIDLTNGGKIDQSCTSLTIALLVALISTFDWSNSL